MKKIILLLAFSLSFNAYSQEMSFQNGDVYLGDVQITLNRARQTSQVVSMDAYRSFRKASVIRGWNVLRGIVGGYEFVAGSYNLASGYAIGGLDMAIGGYLIGIIPSKESKRRMWITEGVKKYNAASKEN